MPKSERTKLVPHQVVNFGTQRLRRGSERSWGTVPGSTGGQDTWQPETARLLLREISYTANSTALYSLEGRRALQQKP